MARELKPFVFQPAKAAKSCTQDTIEAEGLIAAFPLEMAVRVSPHFAAHLFSTARLAKVSSRLRRSRAARTSRPNRSIPLMQCSQNGRGATNGSGLGSPVSKSLWESVAETEKDACH
jgi:hypothetical protein